MTPREVIPAEISEEVETEVSTALHKMVADERRFSTPDPRIEKLEAALREIEVWVNAPPSAYSMMALDGLFAIARESIRNALEGEI